MPTLLEQSQRPRHPRPPDVSCPPTGDAALDRAVEDYRQLHARYTAAAGRAFQLTRGLNADHLADDRSFAEAVLAGRKAPAGRARTEASLDELVRVTDEREGLALAANTLYDDMLGLLRKRRRKIEAAAREHRREVAKAALEALDQVTGVFGELHRWQAVLDWIEQTRATGTSREFVFSGAGAGPIVVAAPPIIPGGYVSDEAMVATLVATLEELAAPEPERPAEPEQSAEVEAFAPAIAIGRPGPGSPEGLELARRQAG